MPEEELGAVSDEDDALDEPEAEELDERGRTGVSACGQAGDQQEGDQLADRNAPYNNT